MLDLEAVSAVCPNCKIILVEATTASFANLGTAVNSAVKVLGADYATAARSKGVHGSRLLLRHVLRNSLIPVVTLVALGVPAVFGGAIVTAQIFRVPGIGELLVITAVDLALRRGQQVLTLECRVSNTGAQALYEKYAFERVGVRRRYYTDNNEDALIMTTPPIHTPDYRERFAHLRAVHAERWGAADLLLPD